MAATFAYRSTVSPPRLTKQFQFVPDSGLHHPPALCCRETNLLPLLNAFLVSLHESIRFSAICQGVTASFTQSRRVWRHLELHEKVANGRASSLPLGVGEGCMAPVYRSSCSAHEVCCATCGSHLALETLTSVKLPLPLAGSASSSPARPGSPGHAADSGYRYRA